MATLADIRPDERRTLLVAFVTLFGILAAHTVLETARDALFLARLPASQLPWVYIAMAAAAVAIAQIPTHGLREKLGRFGLSASLLLMAIVTAGFALAPGLRSPWGLRALYVWSGLFGTLSTVQFWLLLGELFTITQAKRLYRVIGVGSLLGAVAGGLIARLVSTEMGAVRLILAAAGLMALTALGPALFLRRPEEGAAMSGAPLRWSFAEARELIATQPYVTRLAGLVLVSTVAVTLGDYVFKSAVARSIPKEDLGMFFATFYAVLNVLALLAQLLLMGFLLRTVGLHRAMWTLPALLMLGAAGVALGGGLPLALLMKGADGTLRNSIHRTGTELLFLPIPDALRARVKPVIDVFGQRGGQAIASLFILSELMIGNGDKVLAVAAAALCAAWIATSTELVPHYVQMFRQALREGTIQEAGGLPALDLSSLEALFAGLNSSDDREVIASLDLLVAEGRDTLIPALILYHPSKRVVLRALEIFERSTRKDFVPVADRLLELSDAEVRAAALRARIAVQPEESVLRAAMQDVSPLVRATAAVNLVASGWAREGPQAAIAPLLASGQPVWRRAVARAIERRPVPAFDKTLLYLALAPEVDVQVSAANAMGVLQDERFLPSLLTMLARHEVRGAAGRALTAYGPAGLAFLEESLEDASFPNELRRQIPRTISRFPAKEAVRALQKRLLEERDGMVRFKILRSMGRLAARNPGVAFDRTLLKQATERTLEVVFRLAHWREVLAAGARARRERSTSGQELLASLLRDKQHHALERLFRLLGLSHRSENFENIYRGALSGNARLRASSRELLESVLQPPWRDAVLALTEADGPWDRKSTAALPFYTARMLGYEELLRVLIEDPSETVRSIAAHHVAELGLQELRPMIAERRANETALFVARVLEKTLKLLDAAAPAATLRHAH